MQTSISQFCHTFHQELLAGAEASGSFLLQQFMEIFAEELQQTGVIDGFEFCHFRRQRGVRVDGFWFNDDGGLDLFVADFEGREDPESLTQTDVNALFKRVNAFFVYSREKRLHTSLEETSPEYGLAREIADRGAAIHKLNLFLFSDRLLSKKADAGQTDDTQDIKKSHHIWDISRLFRQRSSRDHKELLDINFVEEFGSGLACLPANTGSGAFQSYLVVMPGRILADLYEHHGARLLEANVRSFLQARGKVNKGIRATILNEPEMFFSYNNGITVTAQEIETRQASQGLQIRRLLDLQIVNGGQTTASLFHTRRKDGVDLENVFVQMKLSVIPSDASEKVVPKISEYANAQNRVNAADFFSNHPFHIRMEEFSRRIWAPAKEGAQRETKWFYERARGQYADAQSKLTPAEKRRFLAEYPKPQMFTKTDLAKFENVWDEHPRWVNLGAQKNFGRYAARIGAEWAKNTDKFNEAYFRRVIARAIIFRSVERLVSSQPWYGGGFRANIVAYSIATVGELARARERSVDFERVWQTQSLSQGLEAALTQAAKYVHDDIIVPPEGISNISEWCKKEACWTRLKGGLDTLEEDIEESFWDELASKESEATKEKAARKTQRVDDGIELQKSVLAISADRWKAIRMVGEKKEIFSSKELGVLSVAEMIPHKVPSEKQSRVLGEILEKCRLEGIKI